MDLVARRDAGSGPLSEAGFIAISHLRSSGAASIARAVVFDEYELVGLEAELPSLGQ
jgi:hypothetical protein